MKATDRDENRTQDEVLAGLSQSIRSRLGKHLRRIVLFGSRARGEGRADSDYDLLVVVDEVDRGVKDAIDEIAGELLYGFGIVVSAFPISEEATRSSRYSPFLMNIARDGIPV